MVLQSYRSGCVWKPCFVKFGHINLDDLLHYTVMYCQTLTFGLVQPTSTNLGTSETPFSMPLVELYNFKHIFGFKCTAAETWPQNL